MTAVIRGRAQVGLYVSSSRIPGADAPVPKGATMHKRLVLIAVAALAVAFATPAFAQSKDVVDTAVAAGNFTTLAKLLTEAGLVETMKGPGPYTVFAPTDDAFAKVPKETVDALLKDKAKLQAVLTYHVLTSKWSSDDIKMVKSTGTALGPKVAFGEEGGVLTVNGAKVIKADIDCANGMIHVIDAVLMPPQ
jgi:uncharacterized surface protein with fasciclin (FAS1) repeats